MLCHMCSFFLLKDQEKKIICLEMKDKFSFGLSELEFSTNFLNILAVSRENCFSLQLA